MVSSVTLMTGILPDRMSPPSGFWIAGEYFFLRRKNIPGMFVLQIISKKTLRFFYKIYK